MYKKAIAAEVKQIVALEEREEKIKSLKKEKVFEYKINLNILTLIASLGAATLVAINQSIYSILRLVISTLLATLPSLLLYYKSSKQEVDKKENTDSSKNNSRLQYDFDINTLEIEFEDVIRDLNDSYKIIFIIDELDKLPLRLVEDILKLFKTLFNNIDALFIFITDDQFYKTLVDKTKINRGMEYTLFSQKLFLQRPSFLEIRSFLDRIVDITRVSIDEADCLFKLFDLHDVTENPVQLNIDNEKFKEYLNNHTSTNINEITLNTFGNPDKNLLEYKIKWGENESDAFYEKEYSIFDLNISKVSENKNLHEFIILKESNKRIEHVSLFLKKRSYSDFQHYLCYLSQTDFFDLYGIIKDYSKFEINSLYLKIKYDNKMIIRANLQRIIEKFFLKKNILIPRFGIEMMFY